MAEPLVSLARINLALGLDLIGEAPNFTADIRSVDLLGKIEEATDLILDYITEKPEGGWTENTLPPRVRSAIIMAVGSLFDDTERGALVAALAGGNLNNPIVAAIYRLRKPTLS